MKHPWLANTPFAHRGLHGLKSGVVENSRSAFLEAIRHGYGIELDVQPTADGNVVVFHDNSLERMTGREGMVVDFTAEELCRMSYLQSGDKIETLRKALKMIAGRVPVLVEVKGTSGHHEQLSMAVARVIKAYQGPVAVMSFRIPVLTWLTHHLPGVPFGFISHAYANDTEFSAPERQALADLSALGRLKPHFISYGINSLPSGPVEAARKAGVPINCWTVRTRAERALAAAHADTMTFEGFLA